MDNTINYLFLNHDKLFLLIGIVSLCIELLILNITSPLLYFAIGCLTTGVLISFNLLPGWEYEMLSTAFFCILSCFILWKPVKQYQQYGTINVTKKSAVGQQVAVTEVLTRYGGCITFSGSDWQARLCEDSSQESIGIGEYVKVAALDGNVMLIR